VNFKSFKILFIPFFLQFSCLLIDFFQFFFLIFVKDKQKKVLMLMMKTHRRKIIFYRLSDTLYLLLLRVAALLCCDQLKLERIYWSFEVSILEILNFEVYVLVWCLWCTLGYSIPDNTPRNWSIDIKHLPI